MSPTQNYSPSSTHETETSNSSPLLQQTSLAYFWFAIDSYYSRTKRKEEAKARIPALPYTFSSSPMQPCSKYTAQERSGSYYTTLEQSKRKKLKLEFAANKRLLYYSRKEEAKARIPALPYIQLLPHAALQ